MDKRGRKRIYLYLPTETVDEIDRLAGRLDRSRNWCLHRAWQLARESLESLPPVVPGRRGRE